MILGILDLLTGIVFAIGDFGIFAWLKWFIAIFLIVKGVSTILRIPIWMGFISFMAGLVDLGGGALLYFGNGYAGFLVRLAKLLGVLLMLKGGFTVFYGIFAR